MKRIFFLMLCLFFLIINVTSQELKINADIRPRLEYSHGFNNLLPDGFDGGLFVQQRTRLNIDYKLLGFSTYLSFQDVRVWGDTPQISLADNNSFSLAQAWVKFDFKQKWAVKIGRQVISYDDQRIFGGLDWAMQGRFHDAVLLKYSDKKGFKFDAGFAFNQNSVNRINTFFDPNNQGDFRAVFDYKSKAYLWLHKEWNNFKGSFLFLNNSYQNLENQVPVEGVVHRQTIGTHIEATPFNKFNILANIYGQFGEFSKNVDLSAYNTMLELNYKPRKTLLGLGFEILSGDANGNSDGKLKSFFPVFGTNHKFNGFMDYFYVGNHANSVGLQDLYAKAIFQLNDKSSLLTKIHYFNSDEKIMNKNYLGTEIDLVYTQKILPFVTLKIGYSHMFESEQMKFLKNVLNPAETQNWAWTMLIIKPNLFKWNKSK